MAYYIAYRQWYAYHHDGSLYAGQWPQHGPDSNTNGYAAGAYNENLAVVDLDDDGKAEVIVASWPQKGNNRVGKLHVLDYQGQLLHEVIYQRPIRVTGMAD